VLVTTYKGKYMYHVVTLTQYEQVHVIHLNVFSLLSLIQRKYLGPPRVFFFLLSLGVL